MRQEALLKEKNGENVPSTIEEEKE